MVAELGAETASGWDEQLRRWPRSNLLQSYGWGEVQGRAGWATHRLAVPTASGVLPVTALVGATGIPGTTRVYVPRGPVCGPDDQASFAAAEAALLRLAHRCRALTLEVEVPWGSDEVGGDHDFSTWTPARARQPLATVVVDLAPAPEQILASFHAKTRYNVKLAERRGVVVRGGSLDELLGCIRATETRQGIHLPSERHLRTVTELLPGAVRVLVAEVSDEVAAAVLLARWDNDVVYLYGGATGAHRQAMPNHLLHWRAMMEAHEEGCTSYDLWGVPETDRPDHPWRGLAQFKLGFGGHRIVYAGCRRRDLRPAGGWLVKVMDGVRERARRGFSR
ncbi:MAG: lipid II:glycine glycyltransferase FemX [Candidatus Dormibacteria bacterium]